MIFLYIKIININNVNNKNQDKLRSGVAYYRFNLKKSMFFKEQIVTIYNKLIFWEQLLQVKHFNFFMCIEDDTNS